MDEELLRMFRKVEIKIPLLYVIKQITKYAKFHKELCVHKRKKMKRGVELGGIVLTSLQEHNKHYQIKVEILEFSLSHAPLATLTNRSVVQPLGVLEDVLVQVNEMIFLVNFYVLDMEDETSGKGSTLILGQPFLMTVKTKIDVHVGTLSMEFGDTLVQFNIFEVMKHPIEDHSLFGIDLIYELVEEFFQLDIDSEDISNFARDTKILDCLGSIIDEADHDESREVHTFSDFEDNNTDLANLRQEVELLKLYDQLTNNTSSSLPLPTELKTLPIHLKYAYLDMEQQFPVIITNNLHREQEDKLLHILRQHKKAIGWKLSNFPGINPSIYMHRILMEEEAWAIRQQQRRLNPTILNMVKKEVTKLLVAGIIYPISDSHWVNPVQVVPKKSGMTVMKNQHNELVPMRIQNN
ncbi:hypothetical protein CR513_33614, partial [Mucuna pruriens]